MTVRILSKYKDVSSSDIELADVLRCIAVQSWDNVIGVNWQVDDLKVYLFGGNGGTSPDIDKVLFPELASTESIGPSIVSGERLFERSVFISILEGCKLTRIPRAGRLQSFLGGHIFGDVDKEDNLSLTISCYESLIEVTTNSENIVGHILDTFAVCELV